MKRLKSWIVGGLLTLVLAPSAAFAAGIEMSIGGWNQVPVGDISHKSGTGQDNLSLKNDLKCNDETRVFGRIKIDTSLFFPNIYLMATSLRFREKGIKGTSFQFGNVSVAANVPFTSELKLDHYDIGLYYGIPALKTVTAGILNVDLGLNARIIDFKSTVTGQDSVTGQIVSDVNTAVIPVPMLYLGFQVKPVKWLAAEGEARGSVYGKNRYYDLIGRVKFKPYGPVFAAAGYRYEKVNIDRDDIKADTSFGGPFGEIGIEF
jgi:outer membrane protein